MANLKITITINDTDQKILLNDLADIDDWCQNAIIGKISYCWNLMQKQWTSKLLDDDSFIDPIPSNKKDFINLITARSDYTTQKQRDKQRNEQTAEDMAKWDKQ